MDSTLGCGAFLPTLAVLVCHCFQEDVAKLRGDLAASRKEVAAGQQRHVAASKQLQASTSLRRHFVEHIVLPSDQLLGQDIIQFQTQSHITYHILAMTHSHRCVY